MTKWAEPATKSRGTGRAASGERQGPCHLPAASFYTKLSRPRKQANWFGGQLERALRAATKAAKMAQPSLAADEQPKLIHHLGSIWVHWRGQFGERALARSFWLRRGSERHSWRANWRRNILLSFAWAQPSWPNVGRPSGSKVSQLRRARARPLIELAAHFLTARGAARGRFAIAISLISGRLCGLALADISRAAAGQLAPAKMAPINRQFSILADGRIGRQPRAPWQCDLSCELAGLPGPQSRSADASGRLVVDWIRRHVRSRKWPTRHLQGAADRELSWLLCDGELAPETSEPPERRGQIGTRLRVWPTDGRSGWAPLRASEPALALAKRPANVQPAGRRLFAASFEFKLWFELKLKLNPKRKRKPKPKLKLEFASAEDGSDNNAPVCYPAKRKWSRSMG